MRERLPKTLGVIPVRYESTRLPGKALLPILGKPMVQWVYERSKQSRLLTSVLVATDSDAIFDFCGQTGIQVMKTGEHRSGSDRLYEIVSRTDAEIYVNIQGDEPTVTKSHLDALLSPFYDPLVEVSTLKVAIAETEAADPNVVKVVTDRSGRGLYFSRSPIPFQRNQSRESGFFKHIGLYAYRRGALEVFHELPQSELELAERLEQLRFLENGIPITVVETEYDTVGVDTPADLEKAESLLRSET